MDGTVKVGFAARGEIDRTERGLERNQALETGGDLGGGEVTLDLEVPADRQAAAATPEG